MSCLTARFIYGPTRQGSPRLSTVVYCTWMASIAACVALWTLAPTVIFLQSLQKHTVASMGQDALTVPGSTPGPLEHAQRGRHMKLLQAVSAVDCAKQQSAATKLPLGHAAAQQVVTATPHPNDTQQRTSQPKQQQQQQQQQGTIHAPVSLHEQLQQMLGPVDVVYMWVNGSDPVLQRELEGFYASTAAAGPDGVEALRQARFDCGRDELRYSLRSLELYMPWYRKIWLVTNGQVPTWLRYNHPRLTVVPHSSIFNNTSHLPTFNSNAISANLANIPGLSESFVLMDDDMFLTAPWTLSDFIGPDGGQVLTGSTSASNIEPLGNMYLSALKHTAQVFEQRFGGWPRYDPAHAPRLFQLRWLQELQHKFAGEFAATSAAHVRSSSGFIVNAAYQWYVSQHQPGQHITASDDRSVFSAIDDFLARFYMNDAVSDFRARVATGDPDAVAANAERAAKDYHQELLTATAFEARYASKGQAGLQVSHRMMSQLHTLIHTFSAPRAKSVVVNDDISDGVAHVRPLINPVVRQFLESRFPEPTDYELPYDSVNGCRQRLPQMKFGQLPTAEHFTAAHCNPLQPVFIPSKGAAAAVMAARPAAAAAAAIEVGVKTAAAAAVQRQPALVKGMLAPGSNGDGKVATA